MRFKLGINDLMIIDELEEFESVYFDESDFANKIISLLNRLDGKINFQSKVIDKSIRIQNKQGYELEDALNELGVLRKENEILRKMVGELMSKQEQ